MTSNNLGSIYATTISSEKYIIIDSQNIELSGNVIISNSSIITNSIIPNITNNESLGTSSKIWSNAYIHDLSINNNIDVSGALNVMGAVSAPNIYTKTEVDISFVSKEIFDASLSSIQLTNVYTKTEVDVSFVSKELFDASYNVLQTTIINNGSSGSVSTTPKKFYNNNWNLLGNNITTIKDISGSGPTIMGSSADGYTIFVKWYYSTEYTSAPNQTQRRGSLGVYKFISNSWTQIGSTFLLPFVDVPAWRYAENGNGDHVSTADDIFTIGTEYMNSAGNRIAFTVSMPKFGPNQGDYLPNEFTTYIYDFDGTDWVSVGTPRVTNVNIHATGFSFENSITKMFVLNTHTNITIFTHNGTSFVEDAAQISQQTIHNNIGYGYTAHFISTNGKVICIITNNKIILFKFNETSWEQYGNVITIPQWPTNDRTFVAGSYDGSIFMSTYRARTVNGDINAGMIKIFKHNSETNTWIQIGQDIVYEEVTYIDEAQGLQLGSDAKCISGDGTVITVGTRFYPDRYIQHVGPWLNGYVQAYKYSSVNNYWSKIGNDITGQNDERPGQSARLNYNGSVLILEGQQYRDTYSSFNSGRVRVFEIDISACGGGGEGGGGGGGGGSSTDLTSVTSNIIPSIADTYNLGSITNYWENAYINNLITNGIIPPEHKTFNLGSTSNYWNEAYINNLTVATRVYQEINNNSNWNAVNGHYGLMKTSYPALNPITIMESMTWTRRTHVPYSNTEPARKWADVCWSPKLRLFVAVNITNIPNATIYGNIGYSQDGINWNYIYANTNEYHRALYSVCWSDELGIFVACGGASIIMYSADGINWSESNAINWNSTRNPEGGNIDGYDICWSPQLRLFVIIDKETSEGDKIIVSSNGIDWTSVGINYTDGWIRTNLTCICWSPELGIFVALDGWWRGGDKPIASVITSSDGFNWNIEIIPQQYSTWESVCWSPQLGLFAACSTAGYSWMPVPQLMTSRNGYDWTIIDRSFNDAPAEDGGDWSDIIWCAELGLFVVSSNVGYWTGDGPYLVSSNGIDWISRDNNQYLASDGLSMTLHSMCWCPHLGIIVGVGGAEDVSARGGGGQGGGQIWTTSLKIRPPTITNVFDNSFNRIDENGKWDFSNINVKTLSVTGTFTNTSDDRLKHNEIVISNGLAIIDSLTPKFYQKTLTMLDASYNGDLSTQAWTYEAGVIAQELLQISDLSFVVSGGDYYQERYIYSRPTNDPSNANYDPSLNIYDISNVNYTISNNLITQAYNVNYNSVFVYGLAAIKELHQKVKAQETSISTLLTAMLEQQATINSLLTRLQALETSAN